MLTIPNAAEAIHLAALVGKTAASAWTLRLYTALTPALSNGTVGAHLTEAAGGGYAAIPLTAGNWTITPGTPTQGVHPLQAFVFAGALSGNPTVLGYYLTNAAGALQAIEALPVPFTPATAGDVVTVVPIVTLGSLTND